MSSLESSAHELEQNNLKPVAETISGRRHAKHQKSDELDRMLQDAGHLLNYAVEAGIEVEADIAKRILSATSMGSAVWDGSDAGELAAAITKLAAKLKPVTSETLRACREDAHKAINGYKKIACLLAICIIPLSIASFICAGISNKITADITRANDDLLTLHTQMNAQKPSSDNDVPPSLIVGELQKFTIEMRDVYSRTKQLKYFAPFTDDPCSKQDPCNLELSSTNLKSMKLLQAELDQKTPTYQHIRSYATSVVDDISLFWGAAGNFILPLLYALLGACAAVLRAFTQQLNARTFAPTYATPARFYIAGIGGGVVGLFNNVFGQNLSVSPLALAFLVGYATDIFFSFLEGTTQNIGKVKAS